MAEAGPAAKDAAQHSCGVGIIGLSANGGWASLAHLPALRSMPAKFDVVALSASSDKSAEAAAKAHAVSMATGDALVLASSGDVELVVVAVKVPQHRDLVHKALDCRKHVYCEWPLGRSTGEAEEMLGAARQSGVRHFVGLQARSSPALRYVRDLVEEGYVGRVMSTRVTGSGGFPWGGQALASLAYTLDDRLGATLFTIPFGHMIDGFTWVLGDFAALDATMAIQFPQVELTDTGETIAASGPDEVVVSGILESGAVASLHYTGRESPAGNLLWEISGEAGTLLIESGSGHLQYGHLRISGGQGGEALRPLETPSIYRHCNTAADSYADSVAHAYHAVFEDLRTGADSVPNFADAVKLHRLLDRIRHAAGWTMESGI